jgi:2-phosphosulfolactate phosphatase
MRKTVVIDCFPESISRYQSGYAIVAVDVVRASTTAVTIAATGRRCFPVPTISEALSVASKLDHPLLIGEQAGIMPPGFDLNNSPVQLLLRRDLNRPAILLSSSGTRLFHEAAKCTFVYLACLRNYLAIACHLATRFPHVAVVGAGSKGEFREEDQMCCAWIAECLVDLGYTANDRNTKEIISRWSNRPVDAWTDNKSAAYLKGTGQAADLKFIVEHVGDLSILPILRNGEIIMDESALEVRL